MSIPYIHPAHLLPFDDLFDGLEAEARSRMVHARNGPAGLRIYAYSDRCVYDNAWNEFSLMARGLILDLPNRRIAATPFTKFFNYGERGNPALPDEPFEVYEKYDGSLIIIYHYNGKWNAATRGSFDSQQARWAQDRIDAADVAALEPGVTYLAEAVYPENRVVIAYRDPALVLLSAFHADGSEASHAAIVETASRLGEGWKFARAFPYPDVATLIEAVRPLPGNQEGFVVRFASGLRLKFKGDEYRRLHKCITGVTPLALWEARRAGADIEAMRREIPEEFWRDFDAIDQLLAARLETLLGRIEAEAGRVAHLSDKEVGLRLGEIPVDVRGFIFPYRRAKGDILNDPDGRARQKLFEAIRPIGNELPGYYASSAMNRVREAG